MTVIIIMSWVLLRSSGYACNCRQVGQSEISIHQDEDEVMNQLVVGAFFMHPDEGLSICKEWIQVCDWPPAFYSVLLTCAVNNLNLYFHILDTAQC